MPRALIAFIIAMALPATASAKEFCVKSVLCNLAGGTPVAGVQEAFDAALANPGHDDVSIGPGNYSGNFSSDDPGGVTVSGMGPDKTIIFPAVSGAPNYPFALSMKGISYVSDLRVGLPQADGANGIRLSGGASASNIKVDGGGQSALGVQLNNAALWDSSVDLYDNINTAVRVEGAGARLEGDFVSAREALGVSLADGARTRVHASSLQSKGSDGKGIRVSGGTLMLSDSLVDVRASQLGTGLVVSQYGSAHASADVRNTTLVASGYPGQLGVKADAWDYDTTSTATLTDSVLYGFGTPFQRTGGGATKTASIAADGVDRWPNHSSISYGDGALTDTRALAIEPGFTDAASGDYTLGASSPLIDAGLPGALTQDDPAEDLAGNARLADGNGDCTAQRDIGAYERAAATCPPPAPGVTPTDPGTQPVPPAAGDTTAPALTHVKLRRRHRGLVVRFRLSEAATVKVLVGHRAVKRTLRAGARTLRVAKVSHRRIRVRLVATDQAGNHSSIARRLR